MAPITLTEDQLQSLRSLPANDYTMASSQAAAPNSAGQTPVTASTDVSQTDYFGPSSQSSATNSSRTSAEIQRPAVTSAPVKPKAANPLPPLSRDFPKPTEEIDVAEALSRKPGRWSIQGTITAKNARVFPPVDEEKEKAKRQQNLADVKKSLFAAKDSLKDIPMPAPKNNF
ncbi:hypothetical protein CkaCkLH20_08483 [Colletotrichum karsti]|uniref:Uncharacterized protein n=1 Tax=Colletotrichum karsti TaxID=1095194 RepID=A0A9P6LID4_9PEZI|nr:uncharacterized protein CkaCkLH20_08483 [Colletotrichum karsti]KAF9874111.1 hypothetical protein CkaCkLH20_08483 [Colletotrichum karsti]